MKKNILKVGEVYRIRHSILKTLFEAASKEHNPQYPKVRVTSSFISEKTLWPLEKIDLYHEQLHENKEIDCKMECTEGSNIKEHNMLLTPLGRQAYINRKYIKEGRKEYWDSIYDPFKVIIPVFTIVISGLALYLNILSTKKYNELKSEIINQKALSDSLNRIHTESYDDLKNNYFKKNEPKDSSSIDNGQKK